MARLAARSLECRRVLRLISTAARPLNAVQLAGVAAAFEVGEPPGPRRGRPCGARVTVTACWARTLWPGVPRPWSSGSWSRRRGPIEIRHESIGRAVERDLLPTRGPATTPRSSSRWPVCHSLRPAWLAAQRLRTARASAAIEAAGVAAARHAAADELAALELALGIPEDRDSGVVRPWADDAVWDRVGLQVRASEAAFAVGRTARATAYLEVLDRRPRHARRSRRVWASSTSDWHAFDGRPVIRPGR